RLLYISNVPRSRTLAILFAAASPSTIYTLSLHDALPIFNINKIATLRNSRGGNNPDVLQAALACEHFGAQGITVHPRPDERHIRDRKSTRLNSSHVKISYAVFCLKKKTREQTHNVRLLNS